MLRLETKGSRWWNPDGQVGLQYKICCIPEQSVPGFPVIQYWVPGLQGFSGQDSVLLILSR